MKRSLKSTAAIASIFALVAFTANADNPMVGGAAMSESKNIIENAVNSKDHTTLVAAVKAAGLVERFPAMALKARRRGPRSHEPLQAVHPTTLHLPDPDLGP